MGTKIGIQFLMLKMYIFILILLSQYKEISGNNVEIKILKDSGHCMYGDNYEQMVKYILEFLDKHKSISLKID